MNMIVVVVLLTTSFLKGRSCSGSSSASCIRPNDLRPIPYEDTGRRAMRFPSSSQAIVTSYRFTCCGKVTQWGTFVEPGGNREDEQYDITFQVWRPSMANNGCYHLVGENTFTDIILGQGGEVCEAPTTQQQIAVQPGDVVGFYQSHDNGGDRGIQIHRGYSRESVWYQVNPQPLTNQQRTYSVGLDGILQTFTEHAPILAVTIEQSQCAPVTSPAPDETTSPEGIVTTIEQLQLTDSNSTTAMYASRLGSQLSSTSEAPTEPHGTTSQPHTATSSQTLEFTSTSTNLPQESSTLLPTLREYTSDLHKPQETAVGPMAADARYRYAFIASIVTGIAAAIFLALLVTTCILLYILAAKNRKMKDRRLRERLDNSLMYNDIYMELSKARQRDSRVSNNEDGSSNSSFSIPPTLPRTHPPQTRQNSRYVLSTNSSVQPTPNPGQSDNSYYMVPGVIIQNKKSHNHCNVRDGNQVAPCYAVVTLPYNSGEDRRLVKTASNVAYNVTHTGNADEH